MKICFVAPTIYSCLFNDYSSGRIGGAELQQLFIGQELSKKGVDVSYVTLDYGQPNYILRQKIEVYKSFAIDDGFPIIRFIYPRITKTWEAMRRANADIYYFRCAGYLLGIMRLFCSVYKKKYVYAAAHDTDFIPSQIKVPNSRDKLLYLFGLKKANAIIVQSETQRRLLADNFNLKGTVIKNFSPLPPKKAPIPMNGIILWVSTIREWKRPMHFLRLAKAFPAEQFVMIGGSDKNNTNLFEKIKSEADKLTNLLFLGFQPINITETYFDKCKLFVNTSIHEGFPNTFLQAWRRGIPVLTYIDPDNIVRDNNLGIAVNSEAELHQGLNSLLSDEKRINLLSKNIKFYFLENHHKNIIEKYFSIFQEL